jgi:hypothetical protein
MLLSDPGLCPAPPDGDRRQLGREGRIWPVGPASRAQKHRPRVGSLVAGATLFRLCRRGFYSCSAGALQPLALLYVFLDI